MPGKTQKIFLMQNFGALFDIYRALADLLCRRSPDANETPSSLFFAPMPHEIPSVGIPARNSSLLINPHYL